VTRAGARLGEHRWRIRCRRVSRSPRLTMSLSRRASSQACRRRSQAGVLAEMLLHGGRAAPRQSDRRACTSTAPERAAGSPPAAHLDRQQRQIAAHGEAKPFAREKALLVQIGAQRRQSRDLGRRGGRSASARARAAAPAPGRALAERVVTSSVKLDTQPRSRPAQAEACPPWPAPGSRPARRTTRSRPHRHVAAAALDHQDLEEIAMAVGADRPVVDRGAPRRSSRHE